jgi:DNA-binding response OmpR family regulator
VADRLKKVGARVLVVESDRSLADLITEHLRSDHHTATHVVNAEQALSIGKSRVFDAIVLNVSLPDCDGVALCRQMRRSGVNRRTAILAVAARYSESDVVLALENGADAIMCQPFLPGELLWRVNGFLRRWQPPATESADRIVVGAREIVIDVARRTVDVRDARVELTPREFAVLVLLARHIGRVFSRRALAARVWGPDSDIRDRAVDIAIHRLRQQIERSPAVPTLIRTIRGRGYTLSRG